MKAEFAPDAGTKRQESLAGAGQIEKRRPLPGDIARITDKELRFLKFLDNKMSRKAKEIIPPGDILRKLRKNMDYADEMLTEEFASKIVRIFELATTMHRNSRPAITETFRKLVASGYFAPEQLDSFIASVEKTIK